MTRDVRAGRRTFLSGAGALTLALALAACSSPGSDSDSSGGEAASGGGGLPDTIKIMDINGLTGRSPSRGRTRRRGPRSPSSRSRTTVSSATRRSRSTARTPRPDPQQAGKLLASQAISDPSYAAILGPSASAQSAAVSLIVQQAGMPTVYVQSGSDGVIVGDATYRLTPPAASYYKIVGDYIDQQGIKTASILFNAGNPTLAQLGQDTVPGILDDAASRCWAPPGSR